MAFIFNYSFYVGWIRAAALIRALDRFFIARGIMTTNLWYLRVVLTFILLLLSAAPAVSQSTPSSQSPALIEFKLTAFLYPGKASVIMDGKYRTIRIYADGRLIEESRYKRKAKSGRYLDASGRAETQLEKEELAELVNWAEQPDFLNARPEYAVRIVQDNGSSITIAYRTGKLEKKVRVANYFDVSEADKAKLPPSLVKLIEWEENFLYPK